MAKFYGNIGFVHFVEDPPGVHKEVATERPYYGDVIKNTRQWRTASMSQNDNLEITNEISIVADAYAELNFHAMRYIEWMGALWKITNVSVERPRLILSIGGVYNGPTARSS